MAATTAGDSRLALLSQRCQRNPEAARARVAGHIETPYAPTTGDDVDVARPERYSFPQTPWLVDCQPTRVDARDKDLRVEATVLAQFVLLPDGAHDTADDGEPAL